MDIGIIIAIIASVTAVAVVLMVRKKTLAVSQVQNAEETAKKSINEAENEVKNLLSKAHTEAQTIISKARLNVEEEVKTRRQGIADIENRLMQKEKYLDQREQSFNDKEENLGREFEKVKGLKKKQDSIIQDLLGTLEKAAGFSKEEAEKILLSNVEREVRQRAGNMIKDIESQAKKIANRKAKEIVTNAIHRTAMDHVVPATTSTVELPDDEMKGRIIGKEGRNIRAFEAATGVDVIIDDTPGTVILSAFDPIRRELAKMTLKKLVEDGRIHPTRIEEMLEKCREELKEITRERGERAADELGLQFHPYIIELLGKLHYRTSYGQNMLAHSLESAHLAGMLAETLGVNVQLAKRGAVLHDIGKALDFEQSGTHDDIGKEICIKYGESEEVINCIMAHHEEEEPDTIEAVIVMMSDAISSTRPGARRESLEAYIKRLEKLEGIACSFDGVEKAYAIQAGRELRVLVRPEEIDDPGMHKIAFDIAKQIESEVDYPGEVKVSIIRETRASSVAH